jgi:arylsulfatase A-like enzyme
VRVRRRAVFVLVSLLAIAALGFPAATAVRRRPVVLAPVRGARPDIILVTIDALRADHLDLYGYARLTAPLIDDFARGAAVFTNAIAQAPYTNASVASVMTGLYPTSHKTVTTSVAFAETMTGALSSTPLVSDVLPARLTTLAGALRAGGYRTLGFTANPFLIAPFGFAHGFDTFEFFPGGDFASGGRVVAEAMRQVNTAGPGPLFLWVHLMEPHSPYVPPPETDGLFPVGGAPRPIPADVAIPGWLLPGSPRDLRPYVAAYDEKTAAVDVAVDSLLRQLRQTRALNNAVIALTADHGEQFLDHGGWEHSTTLYDELIRVPLLIKAPFLAPGIVNTQVQLIDLMPTLLDCAGLDAVSLPGRSLARMSGRDEDGRPAFAEIAGTEYAVRLGGWKLIAASDGRTQLFDLRADPHELHDVTPENPARAERLSRLLDRNLSASLERGRDVDGETAPVAPAVERRLRALGYIGR